MTTNRLISTVTTNAEQIIPGRLEQARKAALKAAIIEQLANRFLALDESRPCDGGALSDRLDQDDINPTDDGVGEYVIDAIKAKADKDAVSRAAAIMEQVTAAISQG